tara:strand:+ start:190 stop:675 length:486 start_codon:yes stop_codon:yes gene_type:complete
MITIELISGLVFQYAGKRYFSQAEVDAAVVSVKDILDNKPTTWCVVKKLTSINGGANFYVPSETLSDAEIMSLEPEEIYKVSSEIFGENYDDLTATEATEAVKRERTRWAQAKEVNLIYNGTLTKHSNNIVDSPLYGLSLDIFEKTGDPVAPTNADMSGYV